VSGRGVRVHVSGDVPSIGCVDTSKLALLHCTKENGSRTHHQAKRYIRKRERKASGGLELAKDLAKRARRRSEELHGHALQESNKPLDKPMHTGGHAILSEHAQPACALLLHHRDMKCTLARLTVFRRAVFISVAHSARCLKCVHMSRATTTTICSRTKGCSSAESFVNGRTRRVMVERVATVGAHDLDWHLHRHRHDPSPASQVRAKSSGAFGASRLQFCPSLVNSLTVHTAARASSGR
jgi:hypothetical protein